MLRTPLAASRIGSANACAVSPLRTDSILTGVGATLCRKQLVNRVANDREVVGRTCATGAATAERSAHSAAVATTITAIT